MSTTTDLIQRATDLDNALLRRIAERDRRRWNLCYLILEGYQQHRERAWRAVGGESMNDPVTEECGT